MGRPLILIVDDEKRICKLVSDFMKNAGYDTVCAEDGETALSTFCELGARVSLVILDVMLPKLNGWEALRQLRAISDVPVVMLTAKSEDSDQLAGFTAGADDYVSKPFSPSILVARVNSLLKRTRKLQGEKIIFGPYVLNTQSHMLEGTDEKQMLTPREYDLLLFFLHNKGVVLTREQLLNSVWNYDYYGDVRTVDTHIKQLRGKFGESDLIRTVRGVGYQFM